MRMGGASAPPLCFLLLLNEKTFYKMGHFDKLEVNRAAMGEVTLKKRVVDITAAATVLAESESGSVYTINVGSNAATTITLPAITANNLGTYYEFFIGTENTGGIDILTASTDDTTGDVFAGALTFHTDAAEAGALGYVIAGGDVNQINLTGAEANGAGEVGCYVTCVAVSFSADGHSKWQVSGLLGTDDPNGTGAAVFVDRD